MSSRSVAAWLVRICDSSLLLAVFATLSAAASLDSLPSTSNSSFAVPDAEEQLGRVSDRLVVLCERHANGLRYRTADEPPRAFA